MACRQPDPGELANYYHPVAEILRFDGSGGLAEWATLGLCRRRQHRNDGDPAVQGPRAEVTAVDSTETLGCCVRSAQTTLLITRKR